MEGSDSKDPELMVLSEEEEGPPSPGVEASHPIESTLLAPFIEGWRRECVKRSGSEDCDVYYIPPRHRRKQRSKRDIIRYFDDFPSETLSVINFSYVSRPLGLNNAAYEIVRKPYDGLRCGRGSMNYNDNKAGSGLSSSSEQEDDDILEDFSTEMPLVLQSIHNIVPLKAMHKKRRKNQRHERPMTPFMAHEAQWTNLDDDPLGIFTALGGCSSPPTPPPLRALKLTPSQTAEKIIQALQKIKEEASADTSQDKKEEELPLKDNLASHDVSIRKFKNHPVERKYSGFSSGDHSVVMPKLKKDGASSVSHHHQRRSLPCTLHCPGSNGLLPNLTCVSCQCLFHGRCQGVFQMSYPVKSFKCRSCSGNAPAKTPMRQPIRPNAASQIHSIVKVRLPMGTSNGRRPIVELVMHQQGRYQPIKFSNNMQVTEMISRNLFERATALQRTLYQKATRVPRVGGRPIFLAINPTTPHNRGQLAALLSSAVISRPSAPNATITPTKGVKPSSAAPLGEQVSILVRSQAASKPVLLNVPRKIAHKVKVGTTLSFSASSDQKYTVIDNKIHPPVNSAKRNASSSSASSSTSSNAPPPAKRRAPDLSVYKGITISRIPDKRPTPPPVPAPVRRPPTITAPSLRQVTSDLDMSPCTPYCPGVTGFPEVECKGCQSLFHAQCVGLINKRAMSSFLCKMCSRNNSSSSSSSRNTPTVINLD